jgi:hypothetical protein
VETTAHISTIRDNYVIKFTSLGDYSAVSRDNIECWCAVLEDYQRSAAVRVLADVDAATLTELFAPVLARHEETLAQLRATVQNAATELARLNDESTAALDNVRDLQPPSVSATFKRVAQEERLGTISRNVGAALAKYGAKWIAPETLLKVALGGTN